MTHKEKESLNKDGQKSSKDSSPKIKDCKQRIDERFAEIAKHERIDAHLESIDGLHKIIHNLWNLYYKARTTKEAIRILDSIRDAQHDIAIFYNDRFLMENILEALDK